MTTATLSAPTSDLPSVDQTKTKPTWFTTGAAGFLALALTTSYAPAFRTDTGLSGSGWLASDYVTSPDVKRVAPVLRATGVQVETVASKTPAEVIQDLHAQTQLTWDQIARYFGVSRRSVHAWAVGGRMSSVNEEAVIQVADLLEKLSASGLNAYERRVELIQQMNSQRAVADRNPEEDINRPALTWTDA